MDARRPGAEQAEATPQRGWGRAGGSSAPAVTCAPLSVCWRVRCGMPTAGPPAALPGSVEDRRAGLESGNPSLFSPLGSSDSEGNFETPEAETPTRSPLKEFCEPPPGSPEPEARTRGKEPACTFSAPDVENQGGVKEEKSLVLSNACHSFRG